MCFTAVLCRRYSCQHIQVYERHKADCNKRDCAISRSHNPDEHDCLATCAQRLKPERQLLTDGANSVCDTCLAQQ
ncbi:hypothetical protein K523DRAFT_313820 [Schizophyllum commune Tattone D]|nr:hypothetical protein K523DRAFT_313820 [Schizophyllum commune Tattone D]